MKEVRQMEKELTVFVKQELKNRKYKMRQNTIFFTKKDVFICCNFLISVQKTLEYFIDVKNYDYDNILWDIINMPDNKNEPESLKAVGAFSAPVIEIARENKEFSGDYELEAKEMLDNIDRIVNNFIQKHNVDDYIIASEWYKGKGLIYFSPDLKALAYLHKGQIEEAKNFAKEMLARQNRGCKVNEGKGFYEWLLEKY